ncbi:hypothetical protein WMF47_16430 [Sorangium sp. So ce861]
MGEVRHGTRGERPDVRLLGGYFVFDSQLAKAAALSRSASFERFTRTVGLPPMEYLLALRMAAARDLLRRHELGVDSAFRPPLEPRSGRRSPWRCARRAHGQRAAPRELGAGAIHLVDPVSKIISPFPSLGWA